MAVLTQVKFPSSSLGVLSALGQQDLFLRDYTKVQLRLPTVGFRMPVLHSQ